MAVCEIHLNSTPALGRMSSFTAIIPEEKRGPFAVLYLLHGLSDDHTAWTRRTNLERYVGDLPLIVIMPNGERSFYTDARDLTHQNFETYITHDLLNFVDATWQTIASREGRAIAGLSMGGYGAMKLALKNPDLFGAAVSHSGAVGTRVLQDFEAQSEEHQWLREFVPIFGDSQVGTNNDVFALAEKHATSRNATAQNATSSTRSAHKIALRLDCGTEDFLLDENRAFHAHLQKLNIAHEYQEHNGDHNWDYWDAHIPDTLNFVARELSLKTR